MLDASHFLQMLSSIVVSEIHDYPMYMLQAIGLIGIVSILLNLGGSAGLSATRVPMLGLVMGLSSLLLAFVVQDWLQGASKPYLRSDLLFVAAFFGGWRNGVVAFALSWLARYQFGGDSYLLAATLDLASVTIGALLLRHYFKREGLERLTSKEIAQVMCWRLVVLIVPALLFYAVGLLDQKLVVGVVIRRLLVGIVVSLPVMGAVIFLLRREVARERLMYVDALSGLPNRRALQQDMREMVAHAGTGRHTRQVLLLVEVDNFSALVQGHGHSGADEVMRQLGRVLSTLARGSLLEKYRPAVYCFSDHSFALILSGTSMQEVQDSELAHALHARLIGLEHSDTGVLSVRLAVKVIDMVLDAGVSTSWFLRTISSIENTWYARVSYFASDATRQIQQENRLRQQVEQWIAQGAVPLWLQPKVSLVDKRCLGGEALLRAEDPDSPGGYVPPAQVLSVAAKHHLLADLEWATVRTVVGYLSRLPAQCRMLRLAVNVSPGLLNQADFAHRLCALLAKEQVPGWRLIVELTETHQLVVSEKVRDNFTILRWHGVALSLDDFGSGYSSLSLFSELPFDELKLDYAMISSLDNPRTRTAVALAVTSARQHAVSVVAEGIETEEQRSTLLAMGVEHGQGFMFARALPFAEFQRYAQAPLADEEVASGLQGCMV